MYSYLAISAPEDPQWLGPVITVSVVLFSIILALVFNKLLFPIILRFTRWTPTNLDSRIVRATRLPLTFGIVVLAGYLALTVPLDLGEGPQNAVDMIASLLGIILGVMAVAALISNALDWYIENAAQRIRSSFGLRLLPLVRRITTVVVYGFGALLVLDQLNINISPLIAGLGLGGLAVALAIQPTLANLFAGTYVMTEGVVSPGDYIQLENGIAGYVVNVGWRSTRIRTWTNNLVVVPNSKFAETIITNYQQPSPAVNIYLICGTSYDSDLYKVERVCQEVMDGVLNTNPDAVKEYGGWFGYDSFGESNINFWLFLQAKDRLASFVVQTDLIQRLHRRFREEGIVINYPVRALQFPKEWGPEAIAGRNLQHEERAPLENRMPSDVSTDAGEGGEGPGPG